MKLLLLLLLITHSAFAQQYAILNEENENTGYRGLAFINDSSFVVSGSNNTIGKTTNYGKTFQWVQSPDYAGKDFRDIEVFSNNHFVAMAIERPAILLETTDGGKTWQEKYRNNTEGIFLDALYKTPYNELFCLGDPIQKGKPFILQNEKEIEAFWGQSTRLENPAEAFFAASGSNLYVDKKQALIVSGGAASRLYHYNQDKVDIYTLDKIEGNTSGINGLKYHPELNIGYLTGGDFKQPQISVGNFYKFSIQNNKVIFHTTESHPTGYKTDAAIINRDTVVVCGYSGVEISKDGGHSWQVITKDSYNTCAVSPNGQWVVLVGAKGKIGSIRL